MHRFSPSIDWGNELVASLIWMLSAWTISAGCVLLLAFLLSRYTAWGQRFWRVTGNYFTGAASASRWMMLAVLLLSVIAGVRLEVLLSYFSNDLYSALQVAFQGVGAHDPAQRRSGEHGFWAAVGIFCVLATLHIAQIVVDTYLTQRFIIRWRMWLTDRLSGDWLTGYAYYRGRFTEPAIDNPDQRIQQDIDIFTTGVGIGPNIPTYFTKNILLFGAVDALVSVASFTTIMWKLSGPLTLFGYQLHRALFWIVVAYVLIATVVAFWIGRPLIRLSFRNEQTNAAFRYALVRLRDAAEAIGFYRGEDAERRQLSTRFSAIISNYRRYVRRTLGLVGWNSSVSQGIVPLPLVVQAPRLFAGAIKLGDVQQSATAFGKIEIGLSFFRNSYSQFASFNAAIIRLHGLVEANERARRLPSLRTEPSRDDAVELAQVEVRTPAGEQLIDPLDLQLQAGESMLITGSSGTGKTTLLRSLAELWPAASGVWSRPGGRNETMFISQLPYLPLGDLRAVVSYPAAAGDLADDQLHEVLTDVFLPHLCDRLDESPDWAKVLSAGEQQRIAFARVLLTRPKAVFLDEATSALDEGLQFAIYQLLRARLPSTIVVSVGHRGSLEQHHQSYLQLVGEGGWRVGRFETAAN